MRPLAFLLLMTFLGAAGSTGQGFEARQKGFPRVARAFERKESALRELFKEKALPYPPRELFLRAFKREAVLQLWAGTGSGARLKKLKDYPICRFSGGLGPKRREGDGQVPEGFYAIERFNPQSQFHLSLGLDYPNASDRILGRGGRLGGDIFIHGDCVSIGCLAMTDEFIQEIYALAVLAREAGQPRIPVHIFPARMDELGLAFLKGESGSRGEEEAALWAFWQDLRPGYEAFERARTIPAARVDGQGRYRVEP